MSAAGDGSDGILLQHEGPVSWITLDRPDRLNAFAGTMRRDLHDALAAVEERPVARVVVITGTGRAFSAGADVDVMSDLLTRRDDDAFEALVDAGRRVVRLLRELRIPVIAAINGPAAGAGASLALALLDHPHRFESKDHTETRRGESRCIRHHDRLLPELPGKRERAGDRRL